MSEHYTHKGRTMFVCLDKDAEALQGEQAYTLGALMYHTGVKCNARYGIPCPPYVNHKDLACAVCTK